MKLVLILTILSVIVFSGPAVADDPAATKETTKLFVVATSTTGGIAVAAVGNFASAEDCKKAAASVSAPAGSLHWGVGAICAPAGN